MSASCALSHGPPDIQLYFEKPQLWEKQFSSCCKGHGMSFDCERNGMLYCPLPKLRQRLQLFSAQIQRAWPTQIETIIRQKKFNVLSSSSTWFKTDQRRGPSHFWYEALTRCLASWDLAILSFSDLSRSVDASYNRAVFIWGAAQNCNANTLSTFEQIVARCYAAESEIWIEELTAPQAVPSRRGATLRAGISFYEQLSDATRSKLRDLCQKKDII